MVGCDNSATLLRTCCVLGFPQTRGHVMKDIGSSELFLLAFPFVIVIVMGSLVLGIRAAVRYVMVTRVQRKKPGERSG
jgi:hypothetical protein